MKKLTKEFIVNNCGCYEKDFAEKLITSDEVDYEFILNLSIPLKDKYWFFCKKIFTKEQNQKIAIACAEIVLPIYEAKYPENKAPREAIEAAKLYLTGHISIDELLLKRNAAAAADAAAYAAAAAAAYAAAAYAAAAAAAYAAAAAADAAAAAYAAAADAAAKEKLFQLLRENVLYL